MEIFKKIFFILLSLSLIFCTNPSSKNRNVLMVKDQLGREVYIPMEVKKVVGLRAGALRLLLYCGAANRIAGIEESEKRTGRPYVEAFPELKELPIIGPMMGGDAELILKAKPDVIFISYTTKVDADALQQKTGIPVIAIECPEFATEKEKLFDSFRLIAKVINTSEHVDSLITYINQSITELDKRTKNIPNMQKPSVYIGGVAYSGAHGINSTQAFYPPFIFTNSNNVASAIDQSLVSHVKGTFIDKEQLLEWNPDYIFIDQSGYEIVQKDTSPSTVLFEKLKAFQNNQVFTLLPYNNYATNYEMVLVNSWMLASILYPEQFSDIDISTKSNEIITTFFGETNKYALNIDHYRQLRKDNI